MQQAKWLPYAVLTVMATTIRLTRETRRRLAALKSSPRESYDEVLNKLLSLVPRGNDEGQYADAFRVGLLNSRLDIGAGRVFDHGLVKERLGL